MAAIPRRISPLRQAQSSRIELGRYLQLDGGRYLIAAAVLLACMALLTLGQTGQLASKGYQLGQLERQRTLLLREQSEMRLHITEAQSLIKVQQKAKMDGLRSAMPEQLFYLDLAAPDQPLTPAVAPTP